MNLTTNRKIGIAIFFMAIFIYFPLITANYGYLDDYAFLGSVIDGKQTILTQAIEGDRILAGVLTQYLFNTFDSINKIKYIRLFSIVFIAFFSLVFYHYLTASGYDRKSSAALSLLTICTPSFQIYASWAVLVSAPISALLAISASFCFIRFNGFKLFVFRSVLVWLALIFYQPTAMLFFALIPIVIYSQIINKKQNLHIISMIVLYVCSGLAGMTLAYLTLMINPLFGFEISSRADLTSAIYSKLIWFINGPLVSSANIFMLKDQSVTVVLFLVVALILFIVSKKARNPLFFTSYFYSIPLSYTPNLVIAGDWAANRTTVGLQMVWCGILFILFDFLVRKQPNNRNILIIFIVPIAAIVAYITQNDVVNEFITPSSVEYAYVIHEIKKINPPPGSVVCVKPCSWYDSLSRYTSFDDFGRSPFNAPWSASAIFQDAYHSLSPSGQVRFVLLKKGKICNYIIDTSIISSYRTFSTPLYNIGSNK